MDPTKVPSVPLAPIETADTLRARAKHRLMDSGMHGLIAHEVVECIIAAAIMEMSARMKEAMADVARESAKESHRG